MMLGVNSRRTVAPQMVRRINDRIITDLLLAHGPLTRSQLRQLTGLSQPSTAELIDRLEADRIITAVGEAGAGRRGPNARLYAIAADRGHVAVARINPVEVRACVADLTGEIHSTIDLPTSDLDHPHTTTTKALNAAIAAAGVDPSSVTTIIVGTQGTVDPRTGDVDYVEGQPAWHGNLRGPLHEQFQLPVTLENQTNLAGVAEHRHGAGKDRESFVLFSVGHGVAMAIVLNGQIWRGAAGGAGELAVLPASGTDVPLPDPASNTFTGGYLTLISDHEIAALARRHGIDGATPAEAVRTALDSDADGGPLLADLAGRIAVGAAAVCSVLDPGLVVLTGPVGRAGAGTLATVVGQRLHQISPFGTDVVHTLLTEDPVIRGAVTMALDQAHERLWGPATPAPTGRVGQ